MIEVVRANENTLHWKVPDWAQGTSHAVPVLCVPDTLAVEAVKKAIAMCFGENTIGTGSIEQPNGQKDTSVIGYKRHPLGKGAASGDSTVTVQGHVDVDQYGAGPTQVVKGSQWYAPDWIDKITTEGGEPQNGDIPLSAFYEIPVVRRGLPEEREQINPDNVLLGGTGSEFEMWTGILKKGSALPVDVQELISALGQCIPVSIEGWVPQIEHPSIPRENGKSALSHAQLLVQYLLFIDQVIQNAGVNPLPVAVAPYEGVGLANFGHPHVRNVLMQGLKTATGSDLSIEQAANILSQFGVSGLHVTVNLPKDNDGLIGDEFLREVFVLTHGPALVFLKALTLNGNLRSPESVVRRLSTREQQRSQFPTAQVGQVRRLLDPDCIQAVVDGRIQSLERASLCDEDGNVARGPHNPLGRMKEKGRIEMTGFDIDPNIAKIVAIESLMSVYVSSVGRMVLRDEADARNKDGVLSFIRAHNPQWELYLTYLSNQQAFLELAERVETDGYGAVVSVGEKEMKVGDVILDFIEFTKWLARYEGFDPTNDSVVRDRFADIDWLKKTVVQTMKYLKGDPTAMGKDIFDYLDPESPHFGVGCPAMVIRREFESLVEEKMSHDDAWYIVLQHVSEAYRMHLVKMKELLFSED